MADILISDASKYGAGSKVANILEGSQLGVGLNAEMLDVATPLILTPAVLVVMQTPAMFDNRPDVGRMIKQTIECCPKAVTGIDISYELGTGEGPAGHDGQSIEVPTKTTRGKISPSFTFNEVTGNLFWDLTRLWMFEINHPDNYVSQSTNEKPGSYTMSTYAMSMMVIQFDATMRPENIINAAFITNMYPKGTGEMGMTRQIGQVTAIERTIPFTGHIQHNDYIRTLAISVAQKLNIHTVNYNNARPTVGAINTAIENAGYNTEVQSMLQKTT